MALTKTAVVDTALELLRESGLPGMSMRTLATQLGVQPSALYWHVPSKQALLTVVAERILATMGPVGAGRSAADELRAVGEA
ncbi:MAG: TetR family transcriptional regulator, partial [Dietzia maris]